MELKIQCSVSTRLYYFVLVNFSLVKEYIKSILYETQYWFEYFALGRFLIVEYDLNSLILNTILVSQEIYINIYSNIIPF